MPWTIPDHEASAIEAIQRGVISGNPDHLANVPEPLQSAQHQARVAALSILNELGGPTSVVEFPWTPGWPPSTPPVEPPPIGPDAFMSYDPSGPIVLSGETGVVIEGYSFENLLRPQKPILLENCHNITIRNIDTRGCTMGLVFALNCTGLEIGNIRVENIAREFAGQDLNAMGGNMNDMNLIQLDKVSDYYIHDVRGRYGNTEDVFSNYMSHEGIIERIHFEGATRTDQPTSDGSPSVPWTSNSGTGIILGDEGGYDVQVSDVILVNAGQVLFQGMGHDQGFDNCIGIGEGDTAQPWNTGATTWGDNGGLHFTNMRIKYLRNGQPSGSWWNAETPDTTGSNFDDDTLDIEDYRVVL